MGIIIKPIVTEKQTAITEKFPNRYGFRVSPDANKLEIKKAVENLISRPMCGERRWGIYRVLDDSTYEGGQHSFTKSITLNLGKSISYRFITTVQRFGLSYKAKVFLSLMA